MKRVLPYHPKTIHFREWRFALICTAIFVLYCAYTLTLRSNVDTIALRLEGSFSVVIAVIFGLFVVVFYLPISNAAFFVLFSVIGLCFGRFTTVLWQHKWFRVLLIIALLLNSAVTVALIARTYSRFSYF